MYRVLGLHRRPLRAWQKAQCFFCHTGTLTAESHNVKSPKPINVKNQEHLREYRKKNKERKAEYDRMYYAKNKAAIKKHISDKKQEFIAEISKSYKDLSERLEKLWDIRSKTDWYSIRYSQLREDPQTRKYIAKMTVYEFVKTLYSSEEWIVGKFKNRQKKWINFQETRSFLESLKPLLHIHNVEDWYRISQAQMEEVGAGGLLTTHSGRLYNVLKFAYPEENWNSQRFIYRGKKSAQRYLYNVVQHIYNSTEIIENFEHPRLCWAGMRNIELDVWLPEKRIAFEYQGEQHFHDLVYLFGRGGDCEAYSKRDEIKRTKCSELGISIVSVPYWWDNEKDSLTDLIRETGIPLY